MSETEQMENPTDGVGTIRDNRDRETALAALQQSEHRYRTIIDMNPNGAFIHTDGFVRYANRAAVRMFGAKDADQLIGKHVAEDLLHPDETEAFARQRQRLLSGKVVERYEVRRLRLDGTTFHTEGSGTVIDYDGEPAVLFMFNDITQRKQAEDELKHSELSLKQNVADLEVAQRRLREQQGELNTLAGDLSIVTDEAARANNVKSDFLGVMSHELRTPMNAIIGMSELLLGSELGSKQRYHTQTILNSAESLLRIMNDILDYSSIEAGTVELDPVPFDLMRLVEDTVESFVEAASEKGLELMVRYVPLTPRLLVGDADRIRQILGSLIGNAIKFTDQGHVLVTVREEIKGVREPGERRLKMSVKDTGIGIPDDQRRTVFEKFYQADGSPRRRFGGAGMGLALSKQLVRLMGGNIDLKSREGSGSAFWCTMALHEQPEVPASRQRSSVGLRVLVVDDMRESCLLLHEQLVAAGISCSTCRDGARALEILRDAAAAGQPFQAAFIDHQMPDQNGEELAKAIKADPAIQDIALIVMPLSGGAADERRLEAAGFSGSLLKPVRGEALTATLATVWHEYSRGNTGYIIQLGADNRRSAAGRRFDHIKVLLAEDSRVNRVFATESLEALGCDVTIACNGKEAVELLQQETFDLVFMDCEMPVMDGFEASRILSAQKRNGEIGDIPIVALTGNSSKKAREKCLASGMNDHVVKPMRQESLLRTLMRWIPESPARDALDMWSFDGQHILLVEDNRVNCALAEEMLNEMGLEVSIAENGRLAVEAVGREQFDLILMDCQMPEMDGFEASRTIRARDGGGEIPIVALTANALKGDREKCFAAGMNDYLTKPVKNSELKWVIAHWLGVAPPESPEGAPPDELAPAFEDETAESLPVLDMEAVATARTTLKDKFGSIVECFFADSTTYIAEIDTALKEGAAEKIVQPAHTLKSSSLQLGAVQVANIAAEIEQDARNIVEGEGDIAAIASQLSHLREAFDAAQACLGNHLAQTCL